MNRRNLLRKAGATSLVVAGGVGAAAASASATDCSPECCRDCPGNCFHCDCNDCSGGGGPVEFE